MKSGHPLPAALDVAVRLKIGEMKARGGPMHHEIEEARSASDIIAEKGDIILYKGPRRGETARAFAALVHAVAVGAFVPGGITMFGQHYEENDDEN